MASRQKYAPAVASERALENRAFVRGLLREKQPEFAALLDLVVQELLSGEWAAAGLPVPGAAACRCR